ncbi:MAG: SufD family Fe-S cluster assembly protein [Candidatus Omnitrophica bacterium]|nr:SufD family Fe-S cluster assembly protein [Candidatus Omnitrophota bacterium]
MQQDYQQMLQAYATAEGNPLIFRDSRIAHLVVHKNKVLGSHLVAGLELVPTEEEEGISLKLRLIKNTRLEYPVHLCFGIIPEEGQQVIRIQADIEDNASIKIIAHCVFPNAVRIIHKMDAQIKIGDNSSYEYNEVHFHGNNGGISVLPKARISLGKKSHLVTNFSLLNGRVGLFDLDYDTVVGEDSSLEMSAKIYGFADDVIKLKEVGRLIGRNARGVIKSRIAVKERAQSEVINEMIADAPDARGHVDCIEIIQGNATAKAVPIVDVRNEFAQVTHEAAIGRVDKKQIETLMARGLDEEQAIDVVISGMLK